MRITKIAITGGPCAGKTTALKCIQEEFSKRGYTVLLVPETATELISGGVAPWTCHTKYQYQVLQMSLQLFKEKVFFEAAKGMDADKIIIACDRGELDAKAYMTDEDFARAAIEIGTTEESLMNSYDAVFHLVTAANGAESFYTTANNTARIETVDEAIALDNKVIESWTGHKYFRIIDNSTDFKEKMSRLIREIEEFFA